MLIKVPTLCCALCMLRATNFTTVKQVKQFLAKAKLEADSRDWTFTAQDAGGQRAAFCITTPHEQKLEKVLTECGFVKTFEFQRRKGYDLTGNFNTLKMWMINW